MISPLTAAKAAPILLRLTQPEKPGARGTHPSPLLASVGEASRMAQDVRKEMASRRVEALKERLKALGLMMKIDPRSALKMAAELARELKSAVKAYVDAGGRNVGGGDLAMIRSRLSDAEDTRDTSAGATGQTASAIGDPEMKRAQKAYATANIATQNQLIDELTEIETVAFGDKGFFDEVKRLIAGLREAHDKIRAAVPFALRKPTDEDWEEADKAQVDLERQIAGAPTTPAGVGGRVAVTA